MRRASRKALSECERMTRVISSYFILYWRSFWISFLLTFRSSVFQKRCVRVLDGFFCDRGMRREYEKMKWENENDFLLGIKISYQNFSSIANSLTCIYDFLYQKTIYIPIFSFIWAKKPFLYNNFENTSFFLAFTCSFPIIRMHFSLKCLYFLLFLLRKDV